MKRIGATLARFSEAVLATLLAAMLGMVLVNVVMRYVFGTGISATEELSRTLFVWLTFGGAVLAAWEGAHLGVETLIERLPPAGRLVCTIVSELTVLVCCALLLYGTFRQHDVNATNKSLTTGMAMIWVYGVGYVAAIGIGSATAWRLWCAVAQALGSTTVEAPPHHTAVEAAAKGESAL